jgi:ABC-type proline/glycine betaine transport system permease subunit
MLNPFEKYTVPFDDWSQASVDWLTQNFRPFFQLIRLPIAFTLDGVEAFLKSVPPLVFLICLFLIAWQVASFKIATFSVLSMTFIGFIGAWEPTMTTIALIVTAVLFCIFIGLPLGILAARNDRFEATIRPVLDVMQTMPAFVYLVPIVMLIGIGKVPGAAVTIIFALPPVIRLTNLAIRQVSKSIVEAASAFGSSPLQILFEVQIPLGLHTIMAGVNQTLMLALAMSTLASMIAVEGLGMLVLRGIGRLDVGLAAVGGIGIVLLAMTLDRMTQAFGAAVKQNVRWTQRGPIGLILPLVRFFYKHASRVFRSAAANG